jgi:hypothetical protein
MIKLAFPLRRLPHPSRAEFQRYGFEVHGPLVRQHADALAIQRYKTAARAPARCLT